jgi:hypothetical protein
VNHGQLEKKKTTHQAPKNPKMGEMKPLALVFLLLQKANLIKAK